MKALVFITMVSVLLSGCGSDNVPKYLNTKVLWDMQGCAFIVRHNIGDTMFLDFSKELSKTDCKFEAK